jgi:hypothetical protein
MVHGARYVAHGTRCMVHSTCYMVHGAWYMLNGRWYMVHGTWCMVRGTWHMVHVTWHNVHDTLHLVHGEWHTVYGTRYAVHGTRIVLCVNSGFRHDRDEISAFLGYCAACSGNSLPTFRDNTVVPSSKVKKSKKDLTLDDGTDRFSRNVQAELPLYAA